MERELSMAKDESGSLVSIERLKEQQAGRYFCPRCGNEVIPRQGSEKAWHFAHKEGRCGKTRNRMHEHGKTGQSGSRPLEEYGEGTISQDELQPVADKGFRTCVRCRGGMSKERMQEVHPRTFLCRECYLSIDRKELDELVARHS